jgi:hypothetical protein
VVGRVIPFTARVFHFSSHLLLNFPSLPPFLTLCLEPLPGVLLKHKPFYHLRYSLFSLGIISLAVLVPYLTQHLYFLLLISIPRRTHQVTSMNGMISNDDLNFNAHCDTVTVSIGPALIKHSPIYDDHLSSPRKGDSIQRTAHCLPVLKNLCQSNVLHRGAQQRGRWAQVDGRVHAVGGTLCFILAPCIFARFTTTMRVSLTIQGLLCAFVCVI